jgi:hypothetical protein
MILTGRPFISVNQNQGFCFSVLHETKELVVHIVLLRNTATILNPSDLS